MTPAPKIRTVTPLSRQCKLGERIGGLRARLQRHQVGSYTLCPVSARETQSTQSPLFCDRMLTLMKTVRPARGVSALI